ncbi:hypothetical protein CBM2586_B130568 [Cupriavidus phytorum]|uniref:Uncharacterized protein n=1 Tax=Cupriavidus taiwanensis TaxID=164546 RepID=A0A975XLA0_9BURK|nr:hypothetical protein CBM2586_B130568 [Cupriavidus taiwanensis]
MLRSGPTLTDYFTSPIVLDRRVLLDAIKLFVAQSRTPSSGVDESRNINGHGRQH